MGGEGLAAIEISEALNGPSRSMVWHWEKATGNGVGCKGVWNGIRIRVPGRGWRKGCDFKGGRTVFLGGAAWIWGRLTGGRD